MMPWNWIGTQWTRLSARRPRRIAAIALGAALTAIVTFAAWQSAAPTAPQIRTTVGPSPSASRTYPSGRQVCHDYRPSHDSLDF